MPPAMSRTRRRVLRSAVNVPYGPSANTRTPDENVGDIKAMLAALTYAERRVREIVAQHGVAAFLAAWSTARSTWGECSSLLPAIGTKVITRRLAVSLPLSVATGQTEHATSDVQLLTILEQGAAGFGSLRPLLYSTAQHKEGRS